MTEPKKEHPLQIKPIRDGITTETRPLIKFLTDKIHDEFGIDVKMGFEREAWVETRGPKGEQDVFKYLPKANQILAEDIEHMRASKYQAVKALNPEGIKSVSEPVVREDYQGLIEFKTKPAAPARAVNRLDTHSHAFERFAHSHEPVKSSSNMDGVPHFTISKISYEPHKIVTVQAFGIHTFQGTAGTHLNLSLWKNGKNITFEWMGDERSAGSLIARQLQHYSGADTLLIAPDEVGFKRITAYSKERNNKMTVNHYSDDAEFQRVEYKAPAANARHDLIALSGLIATYKMLKTPEAVPAKGVKTMPLETFGQTLDQFSRSAQMRDLAVITDGAPEMREHTKALQEKILTAAKQGRLAQPEFTPARGR